MLPKIQTRGFCALKYEGEKGGDNPAENSDPEKVRILWDCLFIACQGLKFGINRQPLLKLFVYARAARVNVPFKRSLLFGPI